MRGKGDGAAVSEWRRESGVESQTGKTDVMTHSLIFRSVSSQSGENPDSVIGVCFHTSRVREV